MKITKSQLADIIKEELDKKKFYSSPRIELDTGDGGISRVKVTPQEYLGYEDPRAQVSVFEPGLDLPDPPGPNMVSLDMEALANAYFPGAPYPKEYKRGIETTEQEADAMERHFQEKTSGYQAAQPAPTWRTLPAGGVDEEGMPHSYPITDWPINEGLEILNEASAAIRALFHPMEDMYNTAGATLEEKEQLENNIILVFKNILEDWRAQRAEARAEGKGAY